MNWTKFLMDQGRMAAELAHLKATATAQATELKALRAAMEAQNKLLAGWQGSYKTLATIATIIAFALGLVARALWK